MASSPNAARALDPQTTRDAVEQWLQDGRSLLDQISQALSSQANRAAANQGPKKHAPADLEAASREVSALRSELESLEIAHFDLVCRNLGTLRLHSCRSLGEVLDTLVEITLNFIGVGAFVLYLADEAGERLYPLVQEGKEASQVQGIDLATIEKLSRSAELDDELLTPFGDEMGLLSLKCDDRLIGVLRLIQPFPQKNLLSPADHEFMTLLSEHGGIALRRAWLTSTCDSRWWNPTTLKELLD